MPRTPECPCASCGKLLWSGSKSLPPSKRRCRDCREARRPRPCEICGLTFEPWKNGQRTCSRSCANRFRYASRPVEIVDAIRRAELDRLQRKNRRRRAQLRGVESEEYSLQEIAARDGYRCGICGKRVPMGRRCPDVKAPTIDHIIPLSEGGNDLRSNVHLAHFGCNSGKCARGGGEQLALVG